VTSSWSFIRQLDVTKLIVAIRNFANAPKNDVSKKKCQLETLK